MVKIEKPAAVDRLDEIIDLADGIMIARGDLGVELPPEDVPGLQKRMIRAAREAGKPVVVATQMLESMIASPAPTRAEASDVATAVYDGADAVMLSAETAAGAYPIEAVGIMDRILAKVERDPLYRSYLDAYHAEAEATSADAISAAARHVAKVMQSAAIVTYTTSGATALRAARERPEQPILGLMTRLGDGAPAGAGLGPARRGVRGRARHRRDGRARLPEGGRGRHRGAGRQPGGDRGHAVRHAWRHQSFAPRLGALSLSAQKPSPRIARGRSPSRPMAWRMKKPLSGAIRSTMPRPSLARQAQRQKVVGEQPVEAVGDRDQRQRIEAPPALVARQHLGASGIEPQAPRVDHAARPAPRRRAARGSSPGRRSGGSRGRHRRPAPGAARCSAPPGPSRADSASAARPARARRAGRRSARPARP